MLIAENKPRSVLNTSHRIVLPFYVYAAVAFLIAVVILLLHSPDFEGHYFQPSILTVTHIMALGWGVMIILGASYQLLPVITESKLFSVLLARCSFIFAAIGIPLLSAGFYIFNLGWPAQIGGILINLAVLSYAVNVGATVSSLKKSNPHALFIFTAAAWLLLTTLLGLGLVYNFSFPFLSKDSIHFLSLHAHMGIAGWFLMMVMGAGTRLVPMFLVSKYQNRSLLFSMYWLLNAGIILFLFVFLFLRGKNLFWIPASIVAASLLLFIYYCYQCFRLRLRRGIDAQMKVSLLAALMMSFPLVALGMILHISQNDQPDNKLVMLYGFSIFFGWITIIILGMTFKTLPFIIWNKLYHDKLGMQNTPNPKDLFSDRLFRVMITGYFAGFLSFAFGIYFVNIILLRLGARLLVCSAIFYNWSIIKLILQKPAR